jgi:hypothetical protein
MHDAFIEITKCPLFLTNNAAFKPRIRAWSGYATSAKITSTIGINILYF